MPERLPARHPPAVFSWSSGKDSAYALWRLREEGSFEVRSLLTTVTDAYERVSMHGVREELLDRQAAALGLPVVKVRIPPSCSQELYEERMAETLESPELRDIQHFAFADIYLADLRAYRERKLAEAGRKGVFPIWGAATHELARRVIASGFRAIVVSVDPSKLDASFAGRSYDESLLDDLPAGVDPCGENGEFHTFVSDGPIFSAPIGCTTGEVVTRGGYVFCDVVPA